MSKKDYVLIANAIKEIADYKTVDVSAMVAIEEVAKNLADTFKSQNSRFDTNRFLTACGFNK